MCGWVAADSSAAAVVGVITNNPRAGRVISRLLAYYKAGSCW